MDVTSFWIPGLFLLAPLVVVPLALHVIAPGGASRAFSAAHALAAASTAAAFLLRQDRGRRRCPCRGWP